MRTGDIVETVGDFDTLRAKWRLPYPKKGDILTIREVREHRNEECRKKGIVLLYFKEIPGLTGVCDKQVNGVDNFVIINPNPAAVSS